MARQKQTQIIIYPKDPTITDRDFEYINARDNSPKPDKSRLVKLTSEDQEELRGQTGNTLQMSLAGLYRIGQQING